MTFTLLHPLFWLGFFASTSVGTILLLPTVLNPLHSLGVFVILTIFGFSAFMVGYLGRAMEEL